MSPYASLHLDGGGQVGVMSMNAGDFTLPLVPSHRREGKVIKPRYSISMLARHFPLLVDLLAVL